VFGEDRLIYGSNWPVSDLVAPYDAVFRVVHDYFAAKGDRAFERYFWKNSQAAYGGAPDSSHEPQASPFKGGDTR